MPINGELTFPDVPGKINEHNQSPNAHSVRIDNTVSQSGMAADAKATRDLIENVSGQIEADVDALDDQVTDLKSALDATNQFATDNFNEYQFDKNSNLKEHVLIKQKISDLESLKNAVELKRVFLIDGNGNHVTDGSGNMITTDIYLPVTDKTMTMAGYPADAEYVGKTIANLQDKILSNFLHNQHDYFYLSDKTKNLTSEIEKLKSLYSAVTLVEVYLVDENGVYITDEENNKITTKIVLPVTDKTMTMAGYPADAKAVGKTFLSNLDKFNIPVLYLDNVPEELLAENASKSSGEGKKVRYSFPAFHISGKLSSLKIQGSSSVYFPKKNYTLKFDHAFEAQDTWGKHNKYVIKSNYNDFTHAHNTGCAKLWGAIRKSRVTSDDIISDTLGNTVVDENGNHILSEGNPMLSIGINYGAIDGFPVCVVINSNYWGLYSFNIPKDNWMAGMGVGETQAIVSSDYSTTLATLFRGEATFQPDERDVQDFEIEYMSDDMTEEGIKDSINMLISAVRQSHSTDQEYIDSISEYLDIDSAIDYYIFTCIIGNSDGVGKNYLLDTYDGTKWFFAAYDLDMVFGNNMWNGSVYGSPELGTTFESVANQSQLMSVIYHHCTSMLKQRYNMLRSGALSEYNFHTLFGKYIYKIPKPAYEQEASLWPTTNGTSVLGFNQICDWYRLRCEIMDAEINAL